MAEAFGSGFADSRSCLGGTVRRKSVACLLVLGATLLLHCAPAFAQAPASSQAKKGAQANPNPPAAEPPAPPPAQVWLPPLQNPEHTPVISWDGNLLTIDAENSSLAEIMLGIRSRTGASIDMPGSASRERVAVHLGPAPIREVLSSLLYGTDFNYVIQSSEEDENALGKVILIGRDGTDNDSDVVAADDQPKPKIRLMPGYAAPGKRDFEVAHRNARDDNSSTVAETPAADSPDQSSDQSAVAADSASNPQTDAQQPVAANSETTDPGAADTSSLTGSDQLVSTGTAAGAITSGGSAGASSVGGTSTISQMEQNLQKLYQQRQQLQAQQNRPTPTPAP